MRLSRTLAACAAGAALAGVLSAPAAADRFPAGPGQPIATGVGFTEPGGHGFVHCQALIELEVGAPLKPGTFPGGVVVNRNGYRVVGRCPIEIPN